MPELSTSTSRVFGLIGSACFSGLLYTGALFRTGEFLWSVTALGLGLPTGGLGLGLTEAVAIISARNGWLATEIAVARSAGSYWSRPLMNEIPAGDSPPSNRCSDPDCDVGGIDSCERCSPK